MTSHESEAKTRRLRIDPRLEAAGWKKPKDGVIPVAGPFRSEEVETESGPADYVLYGNATSPVAVVEAKKLGRGPQSVLMQADRYAHDALDSPWDFDGSRIPFQYSSNGEVIYFRDVRDPLNRSRRVAGFHTPAALGDLLNHNVADSHDWLTKNPPSHPRLRDYQLEANSEIEKALADRKRQMLVAMATGTGKTYTLVNEIYRLMKSGYARRVLFLVDRRALAAQAVRSFASFEPEPGLKFSGIYEVYSQRFHRDDLDKDEKFDPLLLPSGYLTHPDKGQAFVYVCTIQRMAINLFGKEAIASADEAALEEADAEPLDIPIHAFDVIVADECHRGYTSSENAIWRRTIDHFDGVKIGLTATPAAHTKAYFKDVVYRYPYDQAVREGHLVDYDVVAVRSDVRMNGMFLQEGEEVGVVDTQTGLEQLDLLDDERQIEAVDVERRATSPDATRKVLEEIKEYALEHEKEWGRFPKTLIFADNDVEHVSHSDAVVDIARDVFGRGDEFVQKITGKVDRPLQWIRRFRNRPKPSIVVTVDLLTTGIDVPDIEYIVFLRTTKSRILFEQMIGRGTRKGEKYPDKSHFTVFDCFDGTLLEYFRNATGVTAGPPDKASRTVIEIIDAIYNNVDYDYNVGCLAKRFHRIDKAMSGEARTLFAQFIADGDLAGFARRLPKLLRDDRAGTMNVLRDERFLRLLVDYPRPERTFWRAYEVEDTVTSEYRIKGLDGIEYKPEDYLRAFATYVNEHAHDITAIEILLERPKGWGTKALEELRGKLAAADQHFTESNLERAHRVRYDKALTDIISMVKHAADDASPLLTAEERVDAAVELCTAGTVFTDEQLQWLARIRDHLVANLSVERDDFNVMPIFSRDGGWKVADTIFDGELQHLLEDLNEALAVAA
jgi:type I restriction enzyme, R subunit